MRLTRGETYNLDNNTSSMRLKIDSSKSKNEDKASNFRTIMVLIVEGILSLPNDRLHQHYFHET